MGECSICCERFNMMDRKKVSCNYCDLESCRKCVQQYLTRITTDAHCMNCKNIWNREFVDLSCTKVFRNNDLKKHRENILLEREKCFLPDTQTILSNRKERDRQIEENIKKVSELWKEVHRIEHQNVLLRLRGDQGPEDIKERRKFVRKCPVTECRGFLSTQWKCEICENHICNQCNEIKGEDHTCDPKNVETMDLLKKDTKACPTCGTMIFKISGCAQMWCPDCHTAFNWNTLQIEKGVIHNPHYYEFQRLGGRARREHGDIPCGGMPTVDDLYQACHIKIIRRALGYYNQAASPLIPPETKFIFDFHRLINHIDHVEVPGYRVPIENNLELRIKYLTNEISEEVFKFTLQKNEKAREKLRDITNILTMVVHTGSDILRQFVNKEISSDQMHDIVVNLRDYTNETLQVISKRYTCVVPQIRGGDWEIERLKF